jgi:acetyltransferase-like isoleucine patch superfamily enzyme
MRFPLIQCVKKLIRQQQLKRRFPKSVIYQNVFADQDSSLGEYSVMFKGTVLIGSRIGSYTYIQANSALYNVDVGSFCSIASGVTIGLGAHPTNMVSTSPVFYDNKQPLPKFFTDKQEFMEIFPRTVIGADVWIGQDSMIKAGVIIGVGAIVGAGSVVTKNITPYSIVGGVPSKLIRMRFKEEIRNRLLKSDWWKLSESELLKLSPSFAQPEMFLVELEKIKKYCSGL